MKTGLNYGEGTPTPCSDRATMLAAAVLTVVNTQKELEDAYDKVPSYTGQWSPEHYYADEQEAFNRACERFERAIDSPFPLYEEGNYVEILLSNKGKQFGTIDQVLAPNYDEGDGTGDKNCRYVVKLVNVRGQVTEDTVLMSVRELRLADRSEHYEAFRKNELEGQESAAG